MKSIKVNRKPINNKQFADYSVILADCVGDPQDVLNLVNQVSNTCGLNIKIKKKKLMVISKDRVNNATLEFHAQQIFGVTKIKYMGC